MLDIYLSLWIADSLGCFDTAKRFVGLRAPYFPKT